MYEYCMGCLMSESWKKKRKCLQLNAMAAEICEVSDQVFER